MRTHLRPLLVATTSLVLALGALSGCGGGTPSAGAPSSAAASRVELGEMELSDGNSGFKIHADGTFESPKGDKIGAVRANGELVDAQGTVVATLGADGKVDFGAASDGTTATITEDATLTVTQKNGETFTVKIGADGKVEGTNPSAGKLTVKGADTQGKKRAALLVLLGVALHREPSTTPPAVETPAKP
jgi:hypothetical protein